MKEVGELLSSLEVKNLSMFYKDRKGYVKAVDDVSFDIGKGRSLGLVGESGCGKTSVVLSIMRLLPSNAKIMKGQILLDGIDLTKISLEEMRKLRWAKVSMIFQGAMNTLNPVFRVGNFMVDVLRLHENMSRIKAKEIVLDRLALVGLPKETFDKYPHELSGGMRQRVIIAMSLLCSSSVILADEPTTAVDVVVQDRILREIKLLQAKYQFALLLVTHNISVVAEVCDAVAVMYAGQIVEYARTKSIFAHQLHPYARALLRSVPSIRGPLKTPSSIAGEVLSLVDPLPGCRFCPRCPFASELCKKEPPMVELAPGHFSKCHFSQDFLAGVGEQNDR